MPSWTEVLGDGPIAGEEPLRMSWRLEALHAPLPLAGRLMRVLSAMVRIPVLPVFHTGQHLALRGPITFQPIGDEHARDVLAPLEQLPKELLGRCFIATALHEHIEHSPVLIHGPPEIMPFAVDGEEDFIQMPLISRPRTPASELIGIGLAECPTPFTDGLIGDDDAAREQEFFHIAVAEADAERQPQRMADDLSWESVVLVAVGEHWCVHQPSISHPTAAQQVDNTIERAGESVPVGANLDKGMQPSSAVDKVTDDGYEP